METWKGNEKTRVATYIQNRDNTEDKTRNLHRKVMGEEIIYCRSQKNRLRTTHESN